MKLRKASIMLTTIIAALVGGAAFDRSSAGGSAKPTTNPIMMGELPTALTPQPSQYPPKMRSPNSGIPQTVPGQKMNRDSSIGAPVRGNGEMGGRR